MKSLRTTFCTSSAHRGDLTEDVELIEGLEDTKRISLDIEKKSAQGKIIQHHIQETSEKYRSTATRAALLFFLMNDLVKIHTYYIFSLSAFKLTFFRGIDNVTEAKHEDEPEAEENPDDGEEDGEEGGGDDAGEDEEGEGGEGGGAAQEKISQVVSLTRSSLHDVALRFDYNYDFRLSPTRPIRS